MPNTRIFLSSTCYDLPRERNAIEKILFSLGHEPVLSEKGRVRFHPDRDTHTSCLDEVSTKSDFLVGILHTRIGGAIFTETFKRHIKVDVLKSKSSYAEYFNKETIYSITHCEILKAVERGIPRLIFVHKSVVDQRYKYEQLVKTHKGKPFKHPYSREMISIFNFIKYINNLEVGNAVYEYKTIKELRANILNLLSQQFQSALEDRENNRINQPLHILPQNNSLFSKRIFEKLKSDYSRQVATHAAENKIIFDKKGGCHYFLKVTIKPKTDYELYYFKADADKDITRADVLRFRNVNDTSGGSYIGYIEENILHLFLFNRAKKNKQFTIELEVKFKEYANNLLDQGSTSLIRGMSDKSKKYEKLYQKFIFPKDAFKNIKLFCHEIPGNKNYNMELPRSIKKDEIHFELNLSGRSLVHTKDPIVRIEMSM